MGRKRFTAEQIIHKLREAEVELAKGQSTGEVCRRLGISEQTYYRWRKEYGGLKMDQAKRLKVLEKENQAMVKRVAIPASPPKGLLFPRTGGRDFRRGDYLGRAFNRVVKKVAPNKSFHSWRHFAITEMANGGIAREIRLRIVGHQEGSVHGGYTHINVETLKAAIETIY